MAKLKRIPGLDCSAPAGQMVPLVLRAQLKAMCALRHKALNWDDPEGVHDMRVLSRRLRSAISDFKPYLRKSSLPRLKLRAIAKTLGTVRDEDVALLALEELKLNAKEPAAEGIEILVKESRKRRQKARSTLKVAIKGSAIDEFRKEFQASLRTLASVSVKKSSNPVNHQPVAFSRLGIDVINARLKELKAGAPHIYSPFEINELHELRILAKRLRYAMELFAVCWGEKMEEMAKEIALLQTSLGELHDCDVWIERLGALLKQTARMDKRNKEIIRLRQGATWLVKHFARERMEHYRDALARWQQWEADGLLTKLKSILEAQDISAKH